MPLLNAAQIYILLSSLYACVENQRFSYLDCVSAHLDVIARVIQRMHNFACLAVGRILFGEFL